MILLSVEYGQTVGIIFIFFWGGLKGNIYNTKSNYLRNKYEY